jgi:hypothetical protein
MPQFAFGSGSLWGTRQDVANSTPQRFGILQEGSVEFSGSIKQLFGQYQFPVAIGRGTSKITAKAKFGQINGKLFTDLFFGISLGSGLLRVAEDEAGVVPTTPFQITVANGATWVDDEGVRDATTGVPLTKVASAPATGNYSVAAGGIYTFAAADTGKAVLISYTYTLTGTGANNKTIITNQLLGVQPSFSALLKVPYQSKQIVMKLNACVSEKLSFGTKLEDFTVPELDFQAMADAANQIGTLSFDE